jgi:hypothetical protein
MNIAQN